MQSKLFIAILVLCFFSCKGTPQLRSNYSINCEGIDIVSLGDNIEEVKTKLDGKYKLEEYEELGSYYILLHFEKNDFITIGHYDSRVFVIGLFSNRYKLSENIYIGMGLKELKLLIPNFKIVIDHHDNIEYIEYPCDSNTVKILIKSKNDGQNFVGIYQNNEDETEFFQEDAIVSGFIIVNQL